MPYTLDACDLEGPYRYVLRVRTDARGARCMAIVQCNPSLATTERADPTVGKVAHWAEEHGFSEIAFLNLFARISPRPSALRRLPYRDLVGARNDAVILRELSAPYAVLVLAWGARLPVGPRSYARRVRELHAVAERCAATAHVVGALTAGGFPRHGRMWNGNNRTLARADWAQLVNARPGTV